MEEGAPEPVVRLGPPRGPRLQAEFIVVRRGRDPLRAPVATAGALARWRDAVASHRSNGQPGG